MEIDVDLISGGHRKGAVSMSSSRTRVPQDINT